MAYFIVRPQYKKETSLPPLNDCTWAEIQQAVQAGKASQYWNVGDRKAIILNGTVGRRTFSNQTIYCYILGFNHNAELEGNNTIHFHVGFDALTDGNHIAFCDSKYGDYGSDIAYRMKTSSSNYKGWSGSYMRSTIVPQFKNALPQELQNVLKAVNKYTDNGSQNEHYYSEDVTATQDKIFLLSEYEVKGYQYNANRYEQNSQLQYDYFKDGNDKIMYKDTSTSTKCAYWLRSPYYLDARTYCILSSNGASDYTIADDSFGFAPAFVVG